MRHLVVKFWTNSLTYLLQSPWLLQEVRPRHSKSGHSPFCNGISPGQLALAWKKKHDIMRKVNLAYYIAQCSYRGGHAHMVKNPIVCFLGPTTKVLWFWHRQNWNFPKKLSSDHFRTLLLLVGLSCILQVYQIKYNILGYISIWWKTQRF